MKNGITCNRCVIVLALVALIIGCFQLETFWPQPSLVRAQLQDGSVAFVSSPIVFGITPGQKLRISLGTKPGPRETPVFWFFTISNSSNQALFRSERMEVPFGEWRFSDVSREDLKIEGEPVTGRAQVMAQVFVEAPRSAQSSDFRGWLEIIDANTGETQAGTIDLDIGVLEVGQNTSLLDFDGGKVKVP